MFAHQGSFSGMNKTFAVENCFAFDRKTFPIFYTSFTLIASVKTKDLAVWLQVLVVFGDKNY